MVNFIFVDDDAKLGSLSLHNNTRLSSTRAYFRPAFQLHFSNLLTIQNYDEKSRTFFFLLWLEQNSWIFLCLQWNFRQNYNISKWAFWSILTLFASIRLARKIFAPRSFFRHREQQKKSILSIIWDHPIIWTWAKIASFDPKNACLALQSRRTAYKYMTGSH